MNANIIKKANDLVNACTEGYVAVLDTYGYPHVATRSVRNADGIFSCYFTTGKGSNMAKSIAKNSKASVFFRYDSGNVTLIGDFEIITDKKTKKDVWVDWFINHYSGGVDDPTYFVVKFITKRVSFWIDSEGAEFDIAQYNKPQSKCGILCKVLNNPACGDCKGCMEMDGKPFWGECPVAVCCIDKGYLHCGNCPDMPCDILHEFSCGDGEHCDKPKGARLEILKYWSLNA